MNKNITLKNLAEQLGLATSTISKALNDSPEISDKTKRRVKELAAINNYYPNMFAKGLKLKKSKTIGVIVPHISSNFFTMVIDGMEEKATELDYKINIYISKDSIKKEKQAIETLIKSQVDGILISPSEETQATKDFEHLNWPKKSNIALLLFDRIIDELSTDKISINDNYETGLATIDLINLGRKKIAYLSGIPNTSVNENRKNGYLRILKEYNLTPRIIEINNNDYPIHYLIKKIRENQIDSIIASDELTTVLTARNILTSGFNIPKEISLIGFTTGKMAENFVPSLSSIDQKAKEQGEIAVQTIIKRMEGKLTSKPIECILRANIIHRESTGFYN